MFNGLSWSVFYITSSLRILWGTFLYRWRDLRDHFFCSDWVPWTTRYHRDNFPTGLFGATHP